MDQQILTIVLQNTLTLHQAYKYLRVLKEHLTAQIFGSEHALAPEDTAWIQQIDPALLHQFTKENLSEEFEKLFAELEKIQVLVIYFAVSPDNELLRSIDHWLKTNFPEKIIIDVKVDQNLIAGCALVWNGVYKDYSLKAKIENNKQEIITYLSQTIHKT